MYTKQERKQFDAVLLCKKHNLVATDYSHCSILTSHQNLTNNIKARRIAFQAPLKQMKQTTWEPAYHTL